MPVPLAAAVAVAVLWLLPRPVVAQEAELALRIADPRIVESSGLAASRRHPGVLWTHNDSGDAARVFAVGGDGRVLATLRLAGVQARDVEAIAAGRDGRGRPALFVADIGDNQDLWPSVTVYRVAEPERLADATVPAERFRFRYVDGPRDAEALLVEPRSNRLYVASKDRAGGALYRAPAELRRDRVDLLRRVAAAPALVTDGAFSPDGRSFVLRDYTDAHLYTAPGRRIARFPLPPQPQGESVTFTADGTGVLAGSEGPGSAVWRVPLPPSARPAPTPGSAGAVDNRGNPAHGSATLPLRAPKSGTGREPLEWAGPWGLAALVLLGLTGVAMAVGARRRR
jgi:hypothetical protein